MAGAASELSSAKTELATAECERRGIKAELAALKPADSHANADAEITKMLALENRNSQLEFRVCEAERHLADQTAEVVRIKDLMERNAVQQEQQRRALNDKLAEACGNVRVMCRVRPLLPHERDVGEAALTAFSENGTVHACSGAEQATQHSFSFDGVFDGAATQAMVFDEVSIFIQSFLDGYDVCLLAYGQTGSGKTHTMLGTNSHSGRGIIPRAVDMITIQVDKLRKQGWTITLQVSCMEVYRETLRDLLSNQTDPTQPKLQIQRDDGHSVVPDLTWHIVMAITT